MNKSIDCKACSAVMVRIKRNSQFEVVGVVIGLLAVKLLSFRIDYWLAFVIVFLILTIADERLSNYEIAKKPNKD